MKKVIPENLLNLPHLSPDTVINLLDYAKPSWSIYLKKPLVIVIACLFALIFSPFVFIWRPADLIIPVSMHQTFLYLVLNAVFGVLYIPIILTILLTSQLYTYLFLKTLEVRLEGYLIVRTTGVFIRHTDARFMSGITPFHVIQSEVDKVLNTFDLVNKSTAHEHLYMLTIESLSKKDALALYEYFTNEVNRLISSVADGRGSIGDGFSDGGGEGEG